MVVSNSKYDERKHAGTKNRGYLTDASDYMAELEKMMDNPFQFRLADLEE